MITEDNVFKEKMISSSNFMVEPHLFKWRCFPHVIQHYASVRGAAPKQFSLWEDKLFLTYIDIGMLNMSDNHHSNKGQLHLTVVVTLFFLPLRGWSEQSWSCLRPMWMTGLGSFSAHPRCPPAGHMLQTRCLSNDGQVLWTQSARDKQFYHSYHLILHHYCGLTLQRTPIW